MHLRKKRFSIRLLILFIIFEFTFTGISGVLLLFYGPFANTKKMIVDGLMATYSHQYIAKIFLSDKQIADIKGDSNPSVNANTSETENISDIKIKNKNDDTITIDKFNGKKFDGFMMVVKDPTRVKVAYTSKIGISGERTSQIAANNGAIAAINGGGFADSSANNKLWTGTGATPTGILMSDGKLINKGEVAADTKQFVMAITKAGKLVVGMHSYNELIQMEDTAKNIISFDKALVVNGKPAFNNDGGQGTNPRTCIGQKQDGTMLLLVLDGRRGIKIGGTLQDAQQIMLQYGAFNATNLDGGSSTTMYYDGDIINNPCDPLGERATASAIVVMP